MAFWAELGAGGRAAVLSLLGVAGIGAGYLVLNRGAEAPSPALSEAQPEAPVAPAQPTTPAAAVPETEIASAPEAKPAPALPSFDSWRVEADGSAVVAGQAEPLSTVRVRVDGVAVAEALASSAGQFATLFTLAATDQPSLMSLESELADGRVLVSEATVALEAIPGPPEPEVAIAVPEAAPKPAEGEVPSSLAAEDDVVAALAVTPDPAPVAPVEAAPEATVPVTQAEAAPVAPAAPAEAAPVAPAEAAPMPAEAVPAAPAAILVTEEGARVLQPKVAPDPVVVANVSLDAITYTPAGEVQVGGRGQAGQFVRLYVDNAPLVTALILDEGAWFSTMPEIGPGVYTLRVDQIDAAGTVTSRIETPFLRETREALASVLNAENSATAEAVAVAPEPTAAPVVVEQVVAAPAVPEASAAPEVVAIAEAPVVPAEPLVAPEAVPVASEAAPATVPEPVVGETVIEAPVPVPELVPELVAEPLPEPEPEAAPGAESAATSAAPQALPVTEVTAEAPPAIRPVSITVQPGFTLWGIAEKEFGEGVLYVQVFEANKDKIRDPDLIYPGQVFMVPAGD